MCANHPKVKTPRHITHLSKCEVFVFGSNLAGHHRGGAARMAHELFGAEWGVGSGPIRVTRLIVLRICLKDSPKHSFS